MSALPSIASGVAVPFCLLAGNQMEQTKLGWEVS